MSYLQYKPVNKRFKEFVSIVLGTAISGFIGLVVAMMRADNQTLSTSNQGFSTIITYGFIGAVVGLVISALVVNTSAKKD